MADAGLSDEELDDLVAEIGQRKRDLAIRAKAMAAQKVKDTAVLPDVGKAIAYAPGKAAVGFAGLPGDVRDLARMGREKAQQFIPEWMKGQAAPWAEEATKTINKGIDVLPTSHDLRTSAEKFTGPWYDPVTRWGKIADTATQTGLTMGRSWFSPQSAKNAVKGVIGITAGTEGAGALTDDNPWARMLGGIGGGAYPAFAAASLDRPGRVLRQALGDATDDEIQAAVRMQEEAAARGIPLAATESFDRGHALTAAIANHPAGEAVFRKFLADRPRQVKSAYESELLKMTGPLNTPAHNASVAQIAAEESLKAAEKQVTAVTSPRYQAVAKDQVDEQKMMDLINKAKAKAAADQTGVLAPHYNQFASRLLADPGTPSITGTPGSFAPSNLPGGQGRGPWQPGTPDVPGTPPRPITDIENLDTARQFTRDQANLPPFAAEAIPKKAATRVGRLNKELKSIMAEGSPEWDAARQLHQDLTRQHVEPLLQSGVGKLAGRGHDPAAYPPVSRAEDVLANAKEVRPETIRTLHTALNAQDPNAFKGIAQTWFENSLYKAGEDLITGPSSTIGAKLANALAGNDNKRGNLEEIIRGISHATGVNPDEAVKGVNTLMEVLRRTGRTPGAGSPTHSRGAIEGELGHTYFGDLLSTISLNPLRPVARAYNDKQIAARYRMLAEAMTGPDAVQTLAKMAKLRPEGITAQYYAASLLGLDKAAAWTTGGQP